MDEPQMGAYQALDGLKAHVDELVRQRQEWEVRFRQAVVERDAARQERDAARAQVAANKMSP